MQGNDLSAHLILQTTSPAT